MGIGGGKARWAMAGLAAASLGAGAGTAGAGTSRVSAATNPPRTGAQLDTFAGSCSAQGTDTFTPPVTNTPQLLTVSYDATGTCTGALNGTNVSNAAVKVRMTVRSYGSCSQAHTVEPGHSTITFADATTIRAAVEYTSMLTEINLAYQGQRSGSAHGHATSLTNRTPPDVALKCARQGDTQIPLDLSLSTDTPLVSQRLKSAANTPSVLPTSSPSSPRANTSHQRLRLYVHPKRARVGRRRSFAFRVTTAFGHPVSGAEVRFAGQRAHTGRRGVTRMIVTLHRPGRDTARAIKSGFRASQRTILARRRD